jgi:magnesium-transporting ATPase (P-type)
VSAQPDGTPLAGEAPPLEQPWALTPDKALEALGSVSSGLSSDEARARLDSFGPNEIAAEEGPGIWSLLLNQFRSPLIYILLIAALVTLLLREFIDAGVIAFILVLNAVVGFSQEYRAERSMAALRQLSRAHARVLRDGRERDEDAAVLVPGDVVLIETGDRVPADCRILHAAALEVDESLLTGESTVVSKSTDPLAAGTPVADRANSLFMGSSVTRGRCRAVVIGTGTRTELGKIAGSVKEIGETSTPLQQRMARFAHVIGAAILVACLIGFAAGLATGEEIGPLFLALVALAVAAIPEGLPIVLTVALAISVRRMAQRHVIIRRLPAVETLGSCNAIGSDKTGTLTQNRMTVQVIHAGGRDHAVSGGGYEVQGQIGGPNGAQNELEDPDSALHLTLLAGALCNDASLIEADSEFEVHGDPTEIALLVAAAKAGLRKDEIDERFVRTAEVPFESERRFAATYHRDDEGDRGGFMVVKGAPEQILAMCDSVVGSEPFEPQRVLERAEAMAREGIRVLGMAYRPLDDREIHSPQLDGELTGLRFAGLQGMIDPPRPEAVAAVRGCQQAGIRVVMITGDHATTGLAIAERLGIASADERAMTGAELERIDDDELTRLVERASVYARVSPQHKLRIVTALQRIGHTVAVTGDGVNDAPALKAADIGAAMGRSGTDVAKEAADMVVTDDNFASIFAAVEEGRVAFDNVRKTTFFLISTGAAAVVAVLASLIFRFPLPFLPAQMLWLNVVTNGVQDVALAFEPGEPDVLQRKPRPRREGVISALLWERTAIAGVVMALGTLFLFFRELNAHNDLETARTVALTTMVLFQVFHVGNSRSEHRSAFAKSPFSNPFLLIGTLIAVSLHIAALYLPFTQFVLRVTPLDLETWAWMIAVAASVIVVVEIHKLVRGPRRTRD